MLHPRVSTLQEIQQELWTPLLAPMGDCRGPCGGFQCSHWEFRAAWAVLAQGTACVLQTFWGWDSEGRRSCSPRVRGVSGQEGFSWDAQGFGQAAELHIPHQSVYKPSVLPAEQMCRAWGLNSLLRKSLMLKSRAPALGVRYEELVGPLLVLSL